MAHSHRDSANDSNFMKLFTICRRHKAVIDYINICDKLSVLITNSEVQNRHSIGLRKENVILDSQKIGWSWRNFVF